MWSSLYTSDHRAKRYEPDSGIFDFKPGVRDICAGRNHDSATDADCKGNHWLYTDVYCNSAGSDADSWEERSSGVQ